MNMIDFITARLDEDEQFANMATDGPWQARSTEAGWCVDVEPTTRGIYVIGPSDAPGADIFHIVRHDPARVLCGVEAKRGIVDYWQPTYESGAGTELVSMTLRLLASEFADHPDYREEWKP